ncbi:hypothetical protein BC826DRAFT_104829 [Russula brevipes]|nr:hypothetical protein BC826DRAFT_104829 [Russula brevipes]
MASLGGGYQQAHLCSHCLASSRMGITACVSIPNALFGPTRKNYSVSRIFRAQRGIGWQGRPRRRKEVGCVAKFGGHAPKCGLRREGARRARERGRGRKAEKTGLRSKALYMYMRTGMVDLGDDALRPYDTTRARREQRAHRGPPESEAISQIATRCQRAVTGPRAYTLTSGQSLFRSSSP